ncbi:DNA/RNA non-specific endonuclease [Loigolactobacillus zhaoyuanensis]|uniref:DNA/RNA non-specific endonuclease n=1 Tax=Loigolactobacillus zhaoyuanensis TaxID=2486017 RepID=UPI000F73DC85|nr:DNA/RNA non-specific endonuclease [Loigolactobacillus zhaoyuanensis]
MKRRKKRQTRSLLVLAVIVIGGWLGLNSSQSQSLWQSAQALLPTAQSSSSNTNSQPSASTNQLAALDYHSGESAVVAVNNNKSTLTASDWQTNHVIYANLDKLNRTSTANTAYLEQRNVADDSLRVRQTVQPTGWHQKFSGRQAILNRGHLVAYSISKGISLDGTYDPDLQSGDQNNLKNLFTQTAFSNQRLQTVYETKIRAALRAGKKVLYQPHAIFRGDELMPRGVQLQALSTDGSLNFNVYIYNVQPGFTFDYSTGTSQVSELQVPDTTI